MSEPITIIVSPAELREGVTAGIPERCECGGVLEHGFGLAGGGFGPWAFCTSEGCERFYKEPMGPDED